MRFLGLIGSGLLTLSALYVASALADDASDALAMLDQLAQIAEANELAALNVSGKRNECCQNNLAVRKEWGSLSGEDRIAYTNAVLCLQSKTGLTPASIAPGVRSRFDDFVATHINQTLTIHYTGTFLAWHRYYTWTYEKALQTECGYEGTQPYWNWGKYANDPASSPLFDGSETSMSGNGEYIPNRGPLVLSLPPYPDIILPAGTGGGCVTTGPFRNMTVNLGPQSLPLSGGGKVTGDGFLYNPRCLRRDITAATNQRFANRSTVTSLVRNSNDIWTFEMKMQGVPGSGSIGVHGGGHFTIAGDPGGDLFVSPGDPAFYLHHGMIDRVWWIWQNQDPDSRTNAISGTGTFLNNPPSANTTLDTIINLGFAGGPPHPMRNLMSTTRGPFCYTYK